MQLSSTFVPCTMHNYTACTMLALTVLRKATCIRSSANRQLNLSRILSSLRFQRRRLTEEMNGGEEERLAVAVRSVEQEDCLVLALHLRGHWHKLRRPKEETLGKALKRISLVASKPDGKGKGKKKWRQEHQDDSPIEAHLYSGSTLVPEDVPNTEAWLDGSVLVVGSDRYSVELNPPAVLALWMPECCMAGYPVVPQVGLLSRHGGHLPGTLQ